MPAFRKPSPPEIVKLHQVGKDTVAAGWAGSPGAIRYRPYKMVEGVDKEFVALPLTGKTTVLLERIPAKATVHFQVATCSAGGESVRSEVVSLILK